MMFANKSNNIVASFQSRCFLTVTLFEIGSSLLLAIEFLVSAMVVSHTACNQQPYNVRAGMCMYQLFIEYELGTHTIVPCSHFVKCMCLIYANRNEHT